MKIASRIPPQNLDMERAILGAIMLEANAIRRVPTLRADHFYSEANKLIFQACTAMDAQSQPIDILTVRNALNASGHLDKVGGAIYIAQLTNEVVSSANIEYHNRVVQQAWIKRTIIRVASHAIDDSYNDAKDVFTVNDSLLNSLFSLEDALRQGKSVRVVSDIVQEAMLRQIEIQEQKRTPGIPTPFRELNEMTGGLNKTDLIILAARPAMGKTSIAMAIGKFIATRKIPVGVFSIEMSATQLVNRLVTSDSGVDSQAFRKGRLDNSDWQRALESYQRIGTIPMYIDETGGILISELRSKTREMVERKGVQLIIIDYLQLINVPEKHGMNREQQVSLIARSLKQIAKDFNVPVIALSQLSRAVETRGGDKRPMLSDLRDSGSIEQEADQVWFLYRPEYYGQNISEKGESVNNNAAELIISKQRNGPVGTVELDFDKTTQIWSDRKIEFNGFAPPLPQAPF